MPTYDNQQKETIFHKKAKSSYDRLPKIDSYNLAVASIDRSLFTAGKKLANRLNLQFVDFEKPQFNFKYLLTLTKNRLEIRENSSKKSKPIFVDLLSAEIKYRLKSSGGKNQLIAKAIGIKNKKRPFIIDATAGFGTDGFIMSTLGAEVIMLERSPIISALLEDGLKRLAEDEISKKINLSLQTDDAYKWLPQLLKTSNKKPDVIYLDPMYPKGSKSALNKKKMRVLHDIVGSDTDAKNLLQIALKTAKNRIVVKRPKLAKPLADLKPDLIFSSNGSCRYDVYFSK